MSWELCTVNSGNPSFLFPLVFVSLFNVPVAEFSIKWRHTFWSELIGILLGYLGSAFSLGRNTFWFWNQNASSCLLLQAPSSLHASAPLPPPGLVLASSLDSVSESIILWLWVSYLTSFYFSVFRCKIKTIVYLKIVLRNQYINTSKVLGRWPGT